MNFDLFKHPESASWTDFYINMLIGMSKVRSIQKLTIVEKSGESITNTIFDNPLAETLKNELNMFMFAKDIADEYDSVIKGGGGTMLSNLAVEFGNKQLMQDTLFGILQVTNISNTKTLLENIGLAVQAYWLGAQLSIRKTPTIPCIGALKNIRTISGHCMFPGIWTPILIEPVAPFSPFLMSFIASAALHLLTLTGYIECFCQYPPPAPPAPGIQPWIGYIVTPLSNPSVALNNAVRPTNLALNSLAIGLDALGDITEGDDKEFLEQIKDLPQAIQTALTSTYQDDKAREKMKEVELALKKEKEEKEALANAAEKQTTVFG
jgi:hypothetical protein